MMHTVSLLTFSAIFPLIPVKSYIVTICCNRLNETIPTNGHSIGIGGEIRKVVFEKYTTEWKSFICTLINTSGI